MTRAINTHGIELVLMEYFGFSTRMVKIPLDHGHPPLSKNDKANQERYYIFAIIIQIEIP